MSYQALLFCPDEKTARVTTQVLTELDFSVEQAADPFAAVKKLMAQHFDAIVVDCENEQNATLIFKSARNSASNQSSLSVAVVEGQAGVAKAFRIGANLVLTKPINIEQSKGTLRVARGLLRKGAESAKKPASGASPSASEEKRIPRPRPVGLDPTSVAHPSAFEQDKNSSAFAPPKFDSVPVPSGALESEPESSPQLDPSEAALLESMPNTVPEAIADHAQAETSTSSKTYPWQPAPKSSAGSMAAALQKAAEAAGKNLPAEGRDSGKSGVPQKDFTSKQSGKPSVAGMSSGHGAASAPARAKEVPQVSRADSETSAVEPKTKRVTGTGPKSAPQSEAVVAIAEAPSFGVDSKEAEPTERNSRPLVAAVVVVVLATAAYFGWETLHGKVSQPAARPVPAQSVPAPAPQATVAPDAADVTGIQASGTALPQPSSTVASSGKTSPAILPKSSSPERVAEDKTVTIETTQPIVVRSESAHPAPPTQEAEAEPEAPNALAISGGQTSAENELSNVVSAIPVSVPKPVPQVVNISQGVSQGLLLKKVQPTYPAQALTLRVEGPVLLRAMISKNGDIKNVNVVTGQPLLARAAAEAVRQWKYKPYYLNGQPVEVQTQITVNFKLPN